MGVLDDAIRQHLELKRQHGAPEEELQRQEEEALGPARRDVAPAETGGDVELEDAPDEAAEVASAEEAPAAEAAEPHEQETVLQEPPEEPPAEPEPIVESDSAADREPLAEEPQNAPYDAAADEPDFARRDESSAGDPLEPPRSTPGEQLAPEAAETDDAPAGEAFGRSPDAREETDAFGALEEEDDAGAEDDDLFAEDDEDGPEQAEHPDDVLEDTPDFLQETPEHDRLWFEQKPPRDFDFD